MQAIHTINETGLAEIAAFLADHHKLGGDGFTPAMLRAWAGEAEDHVADGGDACIELKSWETLSGRTEVFTVAAAGVDTRHEQTDE